MPVSGNLLWRSWCSILRLVAGTVGTTVGRRRVPVTLGAVPGTGAGTATARIGAGAGISYAAFVAVLLGVTKAS